MKSENNEWRKITEHQEIPHKSISCDISTQYRVHSKLTFILNHAVVLACATMITILKVALLTTK